MEDSQDAFDGARLPIETSLAIDFHNSNAHSDDRMRFNVESSLT